MLLPLDMELIKGGTDDLPGHTHTHKCATTHNATALQATDGGHVIAANVWTCHQTDKFIYMVNMDKCEN